MFDSIPLTLTLGQVDAPPAPPEGQAPDGGPGTGAGPAEGQPTDDGGGVGDGDAVSPWFGPLPLLLILVVMMVLLWLPQRREKKRRREMLDALKKNDKVQTIGGVIGTVIDVREHDVLVKVDEGSNTKMRFSRAAIQSILPDGKPADA